MQAEGVSEFLQRAESEIQRRRLLSRGQKILVAVSGGADSMLLLHVLHSLAPKQRWKISVAHFNHQLRGRASDADEQLVRATAKKMSLPFFSARGEVARYARQSKISVEMAARQLRHEFLARVAREQKIFTLALAHHADDQVELFFLRLLRGAGGEGMAGMKWRSPSPADKQVTLVRPLLGFTKAELFAFAGVKKISFRDDATNVSNDFLRNRIRNELLPLLRKNYQPAVDKTILRLMDIVGAETEFAGATAQAWLAKPGIAFERLPVAVQRKVLQRQLTARSIVADFELIEQLREAPGIFVSVAAHLSVACDSSGQIELRELFENEFKKNELKIKLQSRAGRVEFAGRKFRWQIQTQKKFRQPPKKDGLEMFDADRIGRAIILRHWRAGDRFQPIGRPSPVKLQDLFVNAKIPAARRRQLVLATTAAGEIFWVAGLRIGESFKLTPLTKRKFLWIQPQLPA